MRAWMLGHPRLSAAIIGGLAMVVIAARLGSTSATPIGVFLVGSGGIVIGVGYLFGMKFAPRRK